MRMRPYYRFAFYAFRILLPSSIDPVVPKPDCARTVSEEETLHSMTYVTVIVGQGSLEHEALRTGSNQFISSDSFPDSFCAGFSSGKFSCRASCFPDKSGYTFYVLKVPIPRRDERGAYPQRSPLVTYARSVGIHSALGSACIETRAIFTEGYYRERHTWIKR